MSKTKGTKTNIEKLAGWDIDYYLSLSDDECLVCLTQKELYLLRNPLRQMVWRTRWDSKLGTPLPDINDIAERLAFKLSENDCIDFCAEVANCIDTSQEVSNALSNHIAINQNTGVGTPDGIPESTSQTVLNDGSICGADNVFAMSKQVVQLTNQILVDFFENIEALTYFMEQLSTLISAIPIVGLLPVDEAFEFVENFISQAGVAYNAAYNETIENELACEIFCMVLDNDCILDWNMMAQYFADKAVAEILDLNLEDFVEFFIIGVFSGAEWVYASMWMVWGFLSLMSRVFNVNFETMTKLIQATFNDEDPDWMILCEECPVYWEHTFNLVEELDTEFLTVNRGTWISGQGIRSIWTDAGQPGEFQQWVTLQIDFDAVRLDDFTRTGFLAGLSIGSPEEELDYIYRIGTTNTTVRVPSAAGNFDDTSTIEQDDVIRLNVYVIGRAASNPSTTYNYLETVTLRGQGDNPFV